jgi:EAL domain-containing protein (putative c-di-GMP-specific phosphodiesterase class I)
VRRAGQLAMREQLFINFLPNAVYKPESCIRRTLAACKQFGFPVQQIVFEVSESECVDNRHHLLDILKAYTEIGFKTAIDDFGAGYAGLTLLRNYQPNYLKIDMELIRGVDANPVAQSIVRGVLDMAHEIGTEVIAEGVETTAERDWLAAAGVDYQQGYLLARPAYLLQSRAQG